jgi:hypothetical protein
VDNPGARGEDVALEKALGFTSSVPTNEISKKLAKDCFSEVKDPKR